MHPTIVANGPRVIGIAADGSDGASTVLAMNVAVALAATGARVLLGGLDPAGQTALAACTAMRPCGLVPLVLPASTACDPATTATVLATVEQAGRLADRIVLDLGSTASAAAVFYGAAVDDLVLLVDAATGAARRSAGYVAALRHTWAREEVLVVVAGATSAVDAAAPVREIVGAATTATPRLVPLGAVPSRSGRERTELAVLDDPDGAEAEALRTVAAQLLAPRPIALRGGVQFFLEDRLAHRRVG